MRNTKNVLLAMMILIGCGNKGSTNTPIDSGAASDPQDGGAPCGLQTCASQGATCGPIGDGCGGVVDCGACTAPETCGGGGTLFTCGGGNANCTPRTCADVGARPPSSS